jgi:hypothetical protein
VHACILICSAIAKTALQKKKKKKNRKKERKEKKPTFHFTNQVYNEFIFSLSSELDGLKILMLYYCNRELKQ